MSVVDLHPEDLFDREACGSLSPGERTRLDEHLARCSTCRLERLMRADFRDDFASAGRAKLGGMVSLVMQTSAPEMRAQRASKWRVRGAALAAALFVAGGAAASQWHHVWQLFSLSRTLESHDSAGALTSGGAHRTKVDAPMATLRAENPVEADVSGMHDLGQPRRAIPVDAVEKAPGATTTSRAGDEPRVAPPLRPVHRAVETPVRSVAGPLAGHDASWLFDEANLARGRGDYDGALARYREIEDRFPRTPEASVTDAIVARLLLDRGDVAHAIRRFKRYLARGTGSLREESWVGLAQAFGRLGRGDEERAAWSALLAEFPGSIHAGEGREKLALPGEP